MPINDPTEYLTMDTADISGTTLTNRGSSGANGTLVNSPTTGVAGILNQAISFDGSTQEISCGSGVAGLVMASSNSFSAAVWVKPLATVGSGSFLGILTQQATSGKFAYIIYQNNNNLVAAVQKSGTGSNAATATSNFSVGTWYHVCMVYNAVAATLTLYINGVGGTPVAYTFGALAISDGAFTLANDSGGSGRFANVVLDEVRVYGRALTAMEVAALYGYPAIIAGNSINSRLVNG